MIKKGTGAIQEYWREIKKDGQLWTRKKEKILTYSNIGQFYCLVKYLFS